MNIPLPPFPSKPWLAAVLLPWRFQPGKKPEGPPVPPRATEPDAAQDAIPASEASAGEPKAGLDGHDGQDHGMTAESPTLPSSASDTAAGLLRGFEVMRNSAGSTVQDVFSSAQRAVSSLLSAKAPQDLVPKGDNFK